MSVDFEAEGLLDGMQDPCERAERIALLHHLLQRGVPFDDLRRAAAEGRLVLLAVERALDAKGEAYAPTDVAARTGLDVETVRRLRASFGLAIPAADERGLGEPDVEEARHAQQALALGFTEEQLLRLNRDVGMAAAQMAAAMLQAAGEAVLHPGEGEHELAHRLALAAAQLFPMAGSISAYAVQEHLRAQLSRTAITPAELRAGHPSDLHEVTVLFADLVGFTALGQSFGPERLGDVAERLAAIAAIAADPPVTLVKTLGDGAMLVSPEPGALLAAAATLLTAADAEGAGFPRLRGGVRARRRARPRRRLARRTREPRKPHLRRGAPRRDPGPGERQGRMPVRALGIRRRREPQGNPRTRRALAARAHATGVSLTQTSGSRFHVSRRPRRHWSFARPTGVSAEA